MIRSTSGYWMLRQPGILVDCYVARLLVRFDERCSPQAIRPPRRSFGGVSDARMHVGIKATKESG